ncbi:hypothetical protein GTW43_04355 [Streptomyces sp. SID5785]|uniref:hypothetical protein n=1 Tax=Streptomyces sp. SID5785 TaxID=2690309 RepID=UPI001361A364|nr:hypothetical protein [Streptomyces sp. SID5785]MZD04315.1 hypothetical protein [Streptomyces sp. SID5785]
MTATRRAAAAALALLVPALGLLPASPARAAGPAVEVRVPAHAYLTERGVGPSGGYRIWLDPQPGGGLATLPGATLKVDATDLDGTARLRTRRACGDHVWTALSFTCDLGTLTRGKHSYPDALYVEAAPGSHAGDHGTIRYTFSAPGRADASFTTEVWVAGPDLREHVDKPLRGLAPGSTVEFTPRVRNVGRVPAHGFGVSFNSARLDFRTDHRNCWYADTRAAYCWFDGTLDPGRTYAFASPVRVEVPDATVNGSFQYDAYLSGPTGNGEDPPTALTTELDPGMKRGTGPELTVRPVAGDGGTFGEEFGLGEVRLSTTQTADLVAGAGRVAGRTGSTTDVTFTLRNAGPGRVFGSSLEITPPEGTAVVEPTPPPDPDGELEWEWECGRLGGGAYTCGPGRALEPGETWRTTLRLRLDRRVRGAEGRAAVALHSTRPAKDPHPGDNTVPISTEITGGPLVEPAEKAAPAPDGPGGGTTAVLAALAVGGVVAAVAAALGIRRIRARRTP